MYKTYPDETIAECVGNGLTKREYFAAMAMQGEMSAGGSDFNTVHCDRIADIAVAMADALINALNQQGETKDV